MIASNHLMINEVLFAYNLQDNIAVTPFGNGLINHTWKIEDGKNVFILQRINTSIFRHPEYISSNIRAVSAYLAIHHPDYFFCTPVKTKNGNDLVYTKEGCFRLYPFIKNSHTIDVAENKDQTFEASGKFGELTKLLCSFNVNELKITLADFHNISLRYRDFVTAVAAGNKDRIEQSASLIAFLKIQKYIVTE